MDFNPLNILIEASRDDPARIQQAYELHRSTRYENQKLKLLSPDFKAFDLDQTLMKLVNPDKYPDFKDERHVLVFWARPTTKVKNLISTIQEKLLTYFPNIWPVPRENLHMTTMEIAYSRTEPEIAQIISSLKPNIQKLADWTYDHRARLIKPALGFDASAIALTFLPAAGENSSRPRTSSNDNFTFHHLRRDMYDNCRAAGIEVDSRYIVNTSHITIARFVSEIDFQRSSHSENETHIEPEKVKELVSIIEEINQWLEKEYWPNPETPSIKDGGEWLIGEEQGLDLRNGVAWYGGGDRVTLGRGF